MKRTEKKNKKQRFGRPPMDPRDARSERIVTFVTERELAKLKSIAEKEKASLSAVVHKFISNSIPD